MNRSQLPNAIIHLVLVRFVALFCIVTFAFLHSFSNSISGQEPDDKAVDSGVRDDNPPPAPEIAKEELVDPTKKLIQKPVENSIAEWTRAISELDAQQVQPVEDQNPKVTPGQIRWHKDFATACDKSRESGKPVLYFQLLGKLDDRFT